MLKKSALIITILILIASVLGLTVFRQEVRDNFVILTTDVSGEADEIKSKLDLTSSADFVYQASLPEVQPADEFNQSCGGATREHSIVLGCYTQQRFYVFDVEDERLSGVKEVTAAHELLHALYERMPENEKKALNQQLEDTANSIEDERFQRTVAEYKTTEPDHVTNELHSILATEIEVLPTSLEQHYQKYFKNRQKIVSFAKQYESTFTSLEDQIKDYDQELKDLREQKESLEQSLSEQQASIESEQARLDSLRSNNEISAYNNAVPAFNRSIQTYNQEVANLKQVIAEYNELVEKRNALATTQNNLVQQLDSNYAPLHWIKRVDGRR